MWPDDPERCRPAAGACTVLTLIGPRRHREAVHRMCRARQPADSVVDVASVTDAVLMLLSGAVDVVLIDAVLAGDLMGTLTRHTRRSAPDAKLAIFGGAVAPTQVGGAAPPERADQLGLALPWSRLEQTLQDFLRCP